MITDFSELDIAGRRHYMTLNGGGASPDELKKLDARAFAEELIDYNIGYVTHFGVVYPNGMGMWQKQKTTATACAVLRRKETIRTFTSMTSGSRR